MMDNNEKIWRNKVLATAYEFANTIWSPTEKNIYHGYDSNQVLVNTPDADYKSTKFNGWWKIGQQNQGIPYNWGGLCSVKEFQKSITEGKFAGNVPDSRDNELSLQCVGVDCSGLVTACWGLEKKQSTKSLLSFVSKLNKIDMLLPGDVLLLPGTHVMIFIEFTDDTKSFVKIIDATRTVGKVSLRIEKISELVDKGYAGYCMIRKDE